MKFPKFINLKKKYQKLNVDNWHQSTVNTSTGRTSTINDKDSYYCKYFINADITQNNTNMCCFVKHMLLWIDLSHSLQWCAHILNSVHSVKPLAIGYFRSFCLCILYAILFFFGDIWNVFKMHTGMKSTQVWKKRTNLRSHEKLLVFIFICMQ